MALKAYGKSDQLNTKAGSDQAKALLKRSFGRKVKSSTNKFGARRDSFNGRSFDSMMEADYARELEVRKLAKDIREYKCQHRLDLCVNGQHICFYFMDFLITHNDGRMELIEVKGAETRDWRQKFDLTKALLPKGDIPGVPKDAWLTLVKRSGKKFSHQRQVLDYK